MLQHSDLLIEIGTEELPPKALSKLSYAFVKNIHDSLEKAEFEFGEVRGFATPRRLALIIQQVCMGQPDYLMERKGPSVKAAFDLEGNPSKALLGFCRGNGVKVEHLERIQTSKGEWLVLRKMVLGKNLEEMIPDIIENALNALPIPKRMRWGSSEISFVRPVHWLLVMYGQQVIPCTILGIESGNLSYGHRFHHPEAIMIDEASGYEEKLLNPGKVIVDFMSRRDKIKRIATKAAEEIGAKAVIDPDLLDEVTALNEWPVAVLGSFDERFLEVPAEVLIEAMQDHQKYFPLVDDDDNLLPKFITISNIQSKDPAVVRSGNERVIRPRFSDAAFFWHQDLKKPLENHLERLKTVVFQKNLGSLYDKTQRIQQLSEYISERLEVDATLPKRAALLCKCDLMTHMVYEFPSLQGIMGRYYSERSGEPAEVVMALDEVYKPRFSGDVLPASLTGQIIALADRIDTLMGIFAAGLKPTGEKDPFALRRASLGVLRILIETPLDIDLREMLTFAHRLLPEGLGNEQALDEVYRYMMDRLHSYYLDQGITADVIDSVIACTPTRPMDFDLRIHAIAHFVHSPEAASLAAANKRISNILRKSEVINYSDIDPELFTDDAENDLFNTLNATQDKVLPLLDKGEYHSALKLLAALKIPVDRFFEKVMVMADDPKIRANRLASLHRFASLFLRIADFSRLQH